jgi:hypothetical protein|tara:strand:+ start:379 stop:636 length:258 start_codon:yes stop_codon:yes gene_type:complete
MMKDTLPLPPELAELFFIIIDDSRYSREITRNALYAYGMRNVVEVDDGIAAPKVLQKNAYRRDPGELRITAEDDRHRFYYASSPL